MDIAAVSAVATAAASPIAGISWSKSNAQKSIGDTSSVQQKGYCSDTLFLYLSVFSCRVAATRKVTLRRQNRSQPIAACRHAIFWHHDCHRLGAGSNLSRCIVSPPASLQISCACLPESWPFDPASRASPPNQRPTCDTCSREKSGQSAVRTGVSPKLRTGETKAKIEWAREKQVSRERRREGELGRN
eukprot:911842-Rhodomonas_salina.2